MKKISRSLTNDFCPQTLFLYGTYKPDGTPDFGLFCWFSYIHDGETGVMACIGGEKQTKDNIRANGVFSANLVTEELLPLADYFGTTDGRDAHKMDVPAQIARGEKLNVPVLANSPVNFELRVKQCVRLDDGDVFLCRMENVLMDERLADQSVSLEARLREIAPLRTTCMHYFGWDGHAMGAWGEPGKRVKQA